LYDNVDRLSDYLDNNLLEKNILDMFAYKTGKYFKYNNEVKDSIKTMTEQIKDIIM
jgi:uncharacterized protein (DUF2164 family)